MFHSLNGHKLPSHYIFSEIDVGKGALSNLSDPPIFLHRAMTIKWKTIYLLNFIPIHNWTISNWSIYLLDTTNPLADPRTRNLYYDGDCELSLLTGWLMGFTMSSVEDSFDLYPFLLLVLAFSHLHHLLLLLDFYLLCVVYLLPPSFLLLLCCNNYLFLFFTSFGFSSSQSREEFIDLFLVCSWLAFGIADHIPKILWCLFCPFFIRLQ